MLFELRVHELYFGSPSEEFSETDNSEAENEISMNSRESKSKSYTDLDAILKDDVHSELTKGTFTDT